MVCSPSRAGEICVSVSYAIRDRASGRGPKCGHALEKLAPPTTRNSFALSLHPPRVRLSEHFQNLERAKRHSVRKLVILQRRRRSVVQPERVLSKQDELGIGQRTPDT